MVNTAIKEYLKSLMSFTLRKVSLHKEVRYIKLLGPTRETSNIRQHNSQH